MQQLSPAERAAFALANRAGFCELLAQARNTRAPGWWEGSAYRSHPCGLIVGTIKLTNDRHVDALCSIAITDGDGWDRNVCHDSWANGDPHPRPINGKSVTVWRSGSWVAENYAQVLGPRLLEILTQTAAHVRRVLEERAAQERAVREKSAAHEASIAAAALAKAAAIA